jgi:hypothetical protein
MIAPRLSAPLRPFDRVKAGLSDEVEKDTKVELGGRWDTEKVESGPGKGGRTHDRSLLSRSR